MFIMLTESDKHAVVFVAVAHIVKYVAATRGKGTDITLITGAILAVDEHITMVNGRIEV